MPVQKIRGFFLILSLILITGCSATLPNQPAEFSDFVPTEVPAVTKKLVPSAAEGSANFSFNFPDDCEWLPLERTVDGDTIVVDQNVRVRLIGIDTPETKHPSKPIEPFGLEASEFTKNLLKDSSEVCLMTDPIGDTYDKYGRRLAYVFSADGADVNAELLKAGLAKAYTRFPFARKNEFVGLDDQAKIEKVGQWK